MRLGIPVAMAVAGLLAVAPRASAGTRLGRLAAKVRLDAPAASVLAIFGDVTRYPLIFKNVRKARLVERGAGGLPSRWWVELDLGWPLGMRWMRGTTTWRDQQVSFHRTSGTVQRFDGTLEVVPEGRKRCLALYRADFDLGPPRPPGWLGALVDDAVMPDLVSQARRYVLTSVCASTSARCATGSLAP